MSGGARLDKSQFTVRYYDTTDAWSLSSDYATRCAAAVRTWVYETDESGEVFVNSEKCFRKDLSPDDLYYETDDFGNKVVTLPIGTYIIEETKPPTGYLLPDYQNRTFIEVVKPKENSVSPNPGTYNSECYQPNDLSWPAWKLDGE